MAKNILITGGAGFIGVNTAEYYLRKKDNVVIFDNFSRNGSRENAKYLVNNYKNIKVIEGDLRRDNFKILNTVKKADIIFHLAAQVAVTSSIANPREDFEINALGTLNLLEAIRKAENDPILIYSSTNKVYGDLNQYKIKKTKNRYDFVNLPYGISENAQLNFYSPYGCSKGAADQYVHDYGRMFGLRTIVFRQSCIYGPYQYGIEDQGWVAWFIIAAIQNKKITVFGDGKQVRDLLYIDDLIRAYDQTVININKTNGQIYNIGGGVKNAISIWLEFGPILETAIGKKISVEFKNERPGDQKIFISDVRKAKKDFDWKPSTDINAGIKKTYDWISNNLFIIKT